MHGKQSKTALEGSRLDESAWQPVFFVQLSSLQRFYRSTLPVNNGIARSPWASGAILLRCPGQEDNRALLEA
ncbi:hypothetical protein [Stutzerimonas kirkiae]|nr:hypothetical protein [Stutzerimonas kirkiae]